MPSQPAGSFDPHDGAGDTDEPEPDPLEPIADAFLEARRQGAEPSLEELARHHPEHAERIRELFPVLDMLEAARETTTPEAPPEIALRELGDYRIERELGRGGMGIVYEAVQVSLDRRVALKVLPRHAQLDPRHLQRFHREAQAAARLRHPNIVPVFEVGAAEGVHYYAMQLIEGVGLDEVLEAVNARVRAGSPSGTDGCTGLSSQLANRLLDSPIAAGRSGSDSGSGTEVDAPESSAGSGGDTQPRYFANVARIGLQVARALDYAHTEGVLHRDLKPSNLLLDRSGATWITDFGLAKAEGVDAITHTGDVLGTPRYLAPESLRGWSDPRTDVWGLGVTLYELACLRPAFSGEDRGELLRHIAEENPTAPRRIDRRIPIDLETVILAALEKEPERRYAGAAELAEDLARFVAGKPIHARRASWAHRLGLFLRRHRIATAAATVVVLLFAVFTTLWALTLSSARERDRESLDMALEAVTRMQSRIGALRLAGEPRLEQLRHDVLADAVRLHDEFLQIRGDNPRLRYEAALSWARLGSFEVSLERLEEAEVSLRRAEELLRDLALEDPVARAHLANVLACCGRIFMIQLRVDEARAATAEIIEITEDTAPGLEAQRVGAILGALAFAGRFQLVEHRPERAVEVLQRCVAIGDAFLAGESGNPRAEEEVRDWLQSSLQWRAQAHTALGYLDRAEADLLRALEILIPMTEAEGSDAGFRRGLASAHFLLAGIYTDQGRSEEAEAEYRVALAASEQLATDFPSIKAYSSSVAKVRIYFGLLLIALGRSEEAGELLEKAIAEFDTLVRSEWCTVHRRRQLAVAWITLGNLRWMSNPQGAAEALRSALTRLEELRTDVPAFDESEEGLSSLALAKGNLGTLLTRIGKADEGVEFLRESLEHYRRLIELNPDHIAFREKILLMGTNLAGYLRRIKDLDAAEAILRESRELGVETLARAPDSPIILDRLAWLHRRLGNVLKDREAYAEAEGELVAEIALRERLLDANPESPRARSALAGAAHDLAMILERQERIADAIPQYERAIEEETRALETQPGNAYFRQHMAFHLVNLERLLDKCGRHEGNLERLRQAQALQGSDPEFLFYLAQRFGYYAAAASDPQAQAIADEALSLLRRAVELGWQDVEKIRAAGNLASLHEREDYRALLRSLEEK